MAAFLLLVFWIFLGRTAGWQTPAAARYEAWDGTEKTFLGIVYARETKNQQRIQHNVKDQTNRHEIKRSTAVSGGSNQSGKHLIEKTCQDTQADDAQILNGRFHYSWIIQLEKTNQRTAGNQHDSAVSYRKKRSHLNCILSIFSRFLRISCSQFLCGMYLTTHPGKDGESIG